MIIPTYITSTKGKWNQLISRLLEFCLKQHVDYQTQFKMFSDPNSKEQKENSLDDQDLDELISDIDNVKQEEFRPAEYKKPMVMKCKYKPFMNSVSLICSLM